MTKSSRTNLSGTRAHSLTPRSRLLALASPTPSAHHGDVNDHYAHLDDKSAVAKIESDILELEKKLYTLRLTRNTYIPVGRIPPELLLKIFELGMFSQKDKQVDMRQLLKFTWVSRRWKATALGWPELWSTINATTMGWTRECLKRSEGAALSVHLTTRGFESDSDVRPFAQELHRIRQLEVNAPWTSSKLALLQRSAPVLESFTARNLHVGSDNIFAGNCPSLRELKMQQCPFNWTPALISGLTSLCIMESLQVMTLDSLIQQLRLMPNLASLVLKNNNISNETFRNLPPVTLPNLSHFKLINVSVDLVVKIIEKVNLAQNASLIVQCQLHQLNSQGPMLDAFVQASTPPGIIYRIQTSSALPGYMTFALQNPDHPDTPGRSSSIYLGEEPTRFFSSYEHRRLNQVRTLTLGMSEYVSLERWKKTFGPLEQLRDLHLYQHSALSFIGFLMVERHVIAGLWPGHLNSTPLPFPALHTLAFRYITRNEMPNQRDIVSALRYIFFLKRTRGQRLQKLILPIGAFLPVYVKSLREVVDEVVEEQDPVEDAEEEEK
ncbi:hypothetical protein BDN72DRAFT_846794 [Pluteus cervinus]|uniref:Uncharacterized protein n=1 Tax=Pluteus cervinus TaxID=181527 RepID=A0ACD3AFL5_9AGAR|nr:hypothetical protein BDN72DRAFT_846794 [Pluteus cervinus]